MTLFDALRHQWRQRVRSPTWGRSLIGALLLVLAAGYFSVLFVALGWSFPDIVAEVAPNREPLRLLNEVLLYGALGLVPARFFLQRSAGSDVKPYLHLPLRRPQVVRIMQVLSALSLFNLLPVIVLAALWGSTVLPATSAVGAAYGALLLMADDTPRRGEPRHTRARHGAALDVGAPPAAQRAASRRDGRVSE